MVPGHGTLLGYQKTTIAPTRDTVMQYQWKTILLGHLVPMQYQLTIIRSENDTVIQDQWSTIMPGKYTAIQYRPGKEVAVIKEHSLSCRLSLDTYRATAMGIWGCRDST